MLLDSVSTASMGSSRSLSAISFNWESPVMIIAFEFDFIDEGRYYTVNFLYFILFGPCLPVRCL